MCHTEETLEAFKPRNPTDYSPNPISDGIKGADCTHPQSLHCGQISVGGAGCDSVGSNHTLKLRKEQNLSESRV